MILGTRTRTAASLLIAVALTLGASGALREPAAAATAACTPQGSWGTRNADFAARVVALVNEHRASRGLATLTVSTTLRDAAEWKALHMANYSYMTHNDPAPPVARSAGQRLADCGYPTSRASWGENIAYGYRTPEAVVQAWLNSSGHRANIENSSFRAIGVGAASRSGGPIYWAQTFGSVVDAPAGSSPAPTPTTTPTATPTHAPSPTPTATATPAPTATATPAPTAPTFPTWRWSWWR